MDNLYMTPRLLAIASMVDKGEMIADVGCDHGYIPIYLAENNIIKQAIAADVNDGPLLSAEENIRKHGLSHIIKTRKSDGVQNIRDDEYGTLIIAGMGGMLIADILSRAPRGKVCILQPMTAIEYLLKFLSDNGYKIINQSLVKEEKHIYNVIKAVDGNEEIKDVDLYFGGKLKKNELFYEYCKKLVNKFEKIISGLEKSKNPDPDEINRFKGYRDEVERRLRNGD